MVSGPAPAASKDDTITSAMIIMVGAMMFLPLMDVFSKLLSTQHGVSPVTITWTRFAGQSGLLFFAIIAKFGFSALAGKNTWLNIVRGFFVGAAVSIFFIAVKYLPLADAISIFFVEPLVVMFLSTIFLGEKVGWRRALAAIIGFFGALLIIQPTYEIFGWKALLPLATACLFASYLILSRKMGKQDHPYVMQFWCGIGGIAICSLFLAIGQWAGLEDLTFTLPTSFTPLLYLAIIILIATAGHLLIIIAFSRAPVAILAPFQYLEIIALVVAGYVVFGDFPSPIKWLGICIIIGSGLYIFLRERKLEQS